MQDRPDRGEILAALEAFLEKDVVPELRGRRQFLARVAVNAVRTVARELDQDDPSAAESESAAAAELFGAGPSDEGGAAGSWRLALAEAIRAGEFDPDERLAAAMVFLRSEVRGKLAVSNPALLAADSERGIC